ncbi:MAG: hypothetical protein GY821_03960 [Gammaproteobacteria bacterium]|nr:hypothetical protein [Gammaproteobacteria bacterium]
MSSYEKTTNKINKLKMNILKDLKSGDQPIDTSSNNIVSRVYSEVLLEELKDELNAYANTNEGSGKYSTKENIEFTKSVIDKLEKTKKSGKEEKFINEYLMAKAMLDTCKRTNSSIREGFENIENDLFKPKSSGFLSSLFGSKDKNDDDQTNCMKLIKNEFNIEKRVFSKNSKSSSGWFSNFSFKNLFGFGSKGKSANSLLPVSHSTCNERETGLITVKLKGPSNPVKDSKDINIYSKLKIKDAENPDLLMKGPHSQINHKLSFSHSARKNLEQENQHKQVELIEINPSN